MGMPGMSCWISSITIRQRRVSLIDLDVFLDASELAQLGFDADAFGVRLLHDPFRDRDIFFARLVAGVDHHRAVEPGLDAIVAGLLIAMVEVHGEDRFRKDLFGGADHRLEHALVGIFPGAFGKLDNKRRFAANVAAEQPEELFHVVNVVGADGVLAVGVFVKLRGGDDHSILGWLDCARNGDATLNPKSEIENRKWAHSATVVAGSMILTEVP